ncbi:glycosyltransferase family 2 protein [Paraglaciecola sp. L3A3]|uniref:glycosyltransferase family 2 protein n=1 Tax=Paraglaciecola sp. L3A3 TaxID=2686358 RepID=UPI00131E3363|nr:glycosyltransferase family 2 protein [Paraglaciecola sp. L3A3]
MLEKIMPLLRRFSQRNTILCVDFVFFQSNRLVVVGWVLNKVHDASLDIVVSNGTNKLESEIYRFEREDVATHYDLSSENSCFGFLLSIEECLASLNELHIVWGNRKHFFNKLRYEVVDNIAAIKSKVPSCSDNIESILSSTNSHIGVNVEGVTVQPSRIKDKDIQKISNILNRVDSTQGSFLGVLKQSVLPSIHKIWKRRQASYGDVQQLQFGILAPSPKVSVVIPLYGRFDFMQHQIAQFSSDVGMQSVEVIYVLDDPRLEQQVRVSANGLYETFRFPFKLIISANNRGFAGANNLGFKYVSAPLTLFLNSDIIPKTKEWLPILLEQFETLPPMSILGATLLYEDDTVQHMGMCFQDDTNHPGIRMNHHPLKGFHIDLINSDSIFSVQAITGACLLMDTELFKQLEGFDEMHILGDFEDSDLCLKVMNAGGSIFCSGKVQLYHLERLSQDLVSHANWKWKLSMANGVYQETKWKNLIDQVMQ